MLGNLKSHLYENIKIFLADPGELNSLFAQFG